MFRVVEVTTYNDGTKDEVGIYSYATEKEATATFHTKMGGMMKKENVATELLHIINDERGNTIRNEKYINPVVPTPVVEEPAEEETPAEE